jgi:hypothetical protein
LKIAQKDKILNFETRYQQGFRDFYHSENMTENPCVGGSIPPHTTRIQRLRIKNVAAFLFGNQTFSGFICAKPQPFSFLYPQPFFLTLFPGKLFYICIVSFFAIGNWQLRRNYSK